MSSFKNYLSLIKFSHTIFAMPFALIGFFLGISHFHQSDSLSLNLLEKQSFIAKADSFLMQKWWLLLLILLCMVFARSAAMAFNRWLDARFDIKNERTAIREIPAGIISPNHALAFTICCALLFVLTTYFINAICFYLSPVALVVILGYSYTKRFTSLCHLVLGIGLGLAPIGAYLAVTDTFNLLPILFSFAVLFWVSGFDVIYALQDEKFDKSESLHSIPVMVGTVWALRISSALHFLSSATIIMAGIIGGFGETYWIGVAVFIGLLIYQHLIVKPTDLRKVNMAFFITNGIASVVFAFFVMLDFYLHG